MKQVFKNLTTGDEVVHSPGKTVLQNLAAEATNTITPLMIELKTGVSQFIKISFENGIEMQDGVNTLKLSLSGGLEISDGTQTTTLSLLQLLHNDGAGKTNSITEEQVVINDGTNLNVIAAGSVGINNGSGSSSELTPAHLLIEEEGGLTNSITGEQMVISSDSNMAIYGSDSVSLNVDGNTADLSPTALRLIDESYEATLSPASGVHLEGSGGGTVDIAPVGEEVISLQATEVCDVDESGEPTTKTMKVLRGEPTTV